MDQEKPSTDDLRAQFGGMTPEEIVAQLAKHEAQTRGLTHGHESHKKYLESLEFRLTKAEEKLGTVEADSLSEVGFRSWQRDLDSTLATQQKQLEGLELRLTKLEDLFQEAVDKGLSTAMDSPASRSPLPGVGLDGPELASKTELTAVIEQVSELAGMVRTVLRDFAQTLLDHASKLEDHWSRMEGFQFLLGEMDSKLTSQTSQTSQLREALHESTRLSRLDLEKLRDELARGVPQGTWNWAEGLFKVHGEQLQSLEDRMKALTQDRDSDVTNLRDHEQALAKVGQSLEDTYWKLGEHQTQLHSFNKQLGEHQTQLHSFNKQLGEHHTALEALTQTADSQEKREDAVGLAMTANERVEVLENQMAALVTELQDQWKRMWAFAQRSHMELESKWGLLQEHAETQKSPTLAQVLGALQKVLYPGPSAGSERAEDV